MVTTREQALSAWVQQQLNDTALSIHPLPGDASFRRYARILSQNKSYMLMDAPTDKEDSRPFVNIDHFFDQHGVRVPHIVAEDLNQGFILLEDFGDTLLSTVLNDQTADHYYGQAMQQLIALQQVPTDSGLLPAYDFNKLMTEMALLDQWFLPHFGVGVSVEDQQMLDDAYTVLANTALSQPQVVVHRDYHCRNLMVLKDDSNLGVIDFQDAVIGAYTYDLVSILRDAYVCWPTTKVAQWMAEFWQRLPADQTQQKSLQDFQREFDFMAAQRHIKVLGIFVRLNVRDGKLGYMKDLPLVFSYLLQEIEGYAELADFSNFIRQRVLPAFLAKQPEAQALLGQYLGEHSA